MNQNLVFLDIETIPGQTPDLRANLWDSVTPPAQMKKAETIAAWEVVRKPQAVEEVWRKTALDGAFGELWCIGYAWGDEPITCLGRSNLDDAEADLLADFFEMIREHIYDTGPPTWIGHNIRNFDLKFLYHRAVVRGASPGFWLPYNVRPDDTEHIFDTMTQWAGWNNYVKLDVICQALGISGKGDMDGSMVWDAVAQGRFADVAQYCIGDVERVRAVYKRMTFS
jgi:predicted PolB exonuclease-like 3'-5' exonuclease